MSVSLESSPVMLWRGEALTFKTLSVNEAAQEILGFCREDWLKTEDLWSKQLHGEDRARVLDAAAQAVRHRQGSPFDHRMIAADGRAIWLRTVLQVIPGEGKPQELAAISVDITDLKRQEEKLQKSEALVSCVFESLHGELVVLDRKGTIIAVNAAWERFASENEMDPAKVSHGVDYLEVCRRAAQAGDELAAQALEAIQVVLQGSSEQGSLEYPCDSATTARWFVMKVTPLQASYGGAVIVHSNITQLKETQNSLRKALVEVERLKDKLQEENVYLREKTKASKNHHRIVGQSKSIRRVLNQVDQVAATDSTILLLGETGTGKELVAASIHELSGRRDHTLVSVNCAAMPGALVESELFGREKGAFTGSLSRQVGRFELADRSTIFLDEVGELALETQAKLLRVLETRQIERLGNPRPVSINVRVIAATNRDLEKAVGDGKFRQDLYYRLNVFPIVVPPLRDRREDISLLAWAFVDEFAKTFNKDIRSIERESMDALQNYSWPGNVRELRNFIERAMIVATGPKLRIQLPASVTLAAASSGRKLEEVERDHVLSTLESSGWRVRGASGAAERLGLKPTTLEARMAKLGIRRPGTAPGSTLATTGA